MPMAPTTTTTVIPAAATTTAASMAITQIKKDQSGGKEEKDQELISPELKQLLPSLPIEKGWRTSHLYLFQGFWSHPKVIQAVLSAQRHFPALDTDILLATIPKSGTTWLKALTFAIVNRTRFKPSKKNHNHPLLNFNPHDLVPFLEYKLYTDRHRIPDLSADCNSLHSSPRLFATHVPFTSLPISVRKSGCRVVYLCRNLLDTFVSIWHFLIGVRPEGLGPFSLKEAFDMYCKGVVGFGPYWVHMLGYWKESIEKPHKVLFLKYEDMKEDSSFQLKRLAEFLGFPFSVEEERDGVIEEISRLCGFENLKELEVNKSGKSIENFENKSLFRKGEVGDWVNYLSPSMVEQLSSVMEEKLSGTGLSFKVLIS
ncbi:cytosolic sulfotransferase 15-like [Malania oleifera]|uniref:cytosolic sulfotransferase 15-like n=1 Tax=Malania oleifera TaxID=397392 RepID=UPI0025AE7060|nr:cytosolic sulfotransferase 15-like [Malania oleifera]